MHTWVLGVMLGPAKHLQWADHVHRVHLVMQSDENLERLIVALRFLSDCTHLASIVWGKVKLCM